MRFYGALILAALFAIGCSRGSVSPPTSSTTNSVYQMGFAEGRKHAIERPTYSLMVFPKDYTNWPVTTQELYRSAYEAGLGSVK
jgi:hypothetical protein